MLLSQILTLKININKLQFKLIQDKESLFLILIFKIIRLILEA